MPALQVRDFPESAYAALKNQARLNGRSISQETKTILIDYLAHRLGETPDGARGGEVSGPAPAVAAAAAVVPAPAPAATEYANPWRFDPREEREKDERAARRASVFARIDGRRYPALEDIDVVEMIHEMRDDR